MNVIVLYLPSVYPFNSNIAVSSVVITNSSDFVFSEKCLVPDNLKAAIPIIIINGY